jgi:hypothetical protein
MYGLTIVSKIGEHKVEEDEKKDSLIGIAGEREVNL